MSVSNRAHRRRRHKPKNVSLSSSNEMNIITRTRKQAAGVGRDRTAARTPGRHQSTSTLKGAASSSTSFEMPHKSVSSEDSKILCRNVTPSVSLLSSSQSSAMVPSISRNTSCSSARVAARTQSSLSRSSMKKQKHYHVRKHDKRTQKKTIKASNSGSSLSISITTSSHSNARSISSPAIIARSNSKSFHSSAVCNRPHKDGSDSTSEIRRRLNKRRGVVQSSSSSSKPEVQPRAARSSHSSSDIKGKKADKTPTKKVSSNSRSRATNETKTKPRHRHVMTLCQTKKKPTSASSSNHHTARKKLKETSPRRNLFATCC